MTQSSDTRPRRIRWAEMTWRDYVRVGAGIVCLLLGIAGLILPILQGVLFLIMAAMLLAPYSVWVQKRLAWFETKFPWAAEKARELTARWQKTRRSDG